MASYLWKWNIFMVIESTDTINLVWKDYQIVLTANFTKIKFTLQRHQWPYLPECLEFIFVVDTASWIIRIGKNQKRFWWDWILNIQFSTAELENLKSKFHVPVRQNFLSIEIVIYCLGRQAPVAQWIARWTSNPKVVGSSPTWGKYFLPTDLISLELDSLSHA